MEKRLIVVGNSLALIIDKSTRRLIGLSPGLRVNVRTDGRRLIIDPIADDAPDRVDAKTTGNAPMPVALQLDAVSILTALSDRYGMSIEQFRRLHPKARRVFTFLSWARNTNLETATTEEIAIVKRCAVCLEQLQAGRTWNEALAVALYAIPRLEEPPYEEPVSPC